MQHDASVIALAFQNNTELLATGSVKGEIKVWKVSSGACVRKFPAAHTEGITSKYTCNGNVLMAVCCYNTIFTGIHLRCVLLLSGIEFARDGTQLLTASFDQMVK